MRLNALQLRGRLHVGLDLYHLYNKLDALSKNVRSSPSLGCSEHSHILCSYRTPRSMHLKIWDFKLVGHGVVDLRVKQLFGGLVVTAVILTTWDRPSRTYINLIGKFMQVFLVDLNCPQLYSDCIIVMTPVSSQMNFLIVEGVILSSLSH